MRSRSSTACSARSRALACATGRARAPPACGSAARASTSCSARSTNLAVEKLEIELDGDANGKLRLALHVAGTNPDFQNGRPVHYNLSIESRLADLLRESATVSRIPQVIEERLKRFGQSPP